MRLTLRTNPIPLGEEHMNRRTLITGIAALMLLATQASVAQKDKSQRPSPPGQATTSIGGKAVTIDYSRPSAKGRTIFGGIVPYGKVWRTGANEATTLKTEGDITINGTRVPAGTYTLFTLPAEGGAKLIVNKETGQWGTAYKQDQDLVRIDLKQEKTSAPVEQFTIRFEGSKLLIEWENTRWSADLAAAK